MGLVGPRVVLPLSHGQHEKRGTAKPSTASLPCHDIADWDPVSTTLSDSAPLESMASNSLSDSVLWPGQHSMISHALTAADEGRDHISHWTRRLTLAPAWCGVCASLGACHCGYASDVVPSFRNEQIFLEPDHPLLAIG
jgi:hypothetical protein